MDQLEGADPALVAEFNEAVCAALEASTFDQVIGVLAVEGVTEAEAAELVEEADCRELDSNA
jgi:hypothetical protein